MSSTSDEYASGICCEKDIERARNCTRRADYIDNNPTATCKM